MKDRVTIQEAARRLGVKDDAIRKRIQRKSLDHEKGPDGRVYVFLDATHDKSHDAYKDTTRYPSQDGTSQDAGRDESYVAVLDAVQDQVEILRGVIETRDRELEVRTEELRRKDTIIMSLTQRIPELEAAPETRGSDMRPPEGAVKGDVPPEQQEAPQRRWWLYRFFFGP